MLSTELTANIQEQAAKAHCRVCSHHGLNPVLDYGEMPASDGFRQISAKEAEPPRYPLTLVHCPHCALLQLLQTVPASALFGTDYVYLSSASTSWVEHARQLVDQLILDCALTGSSRVIEIASNDGYMLQHFVARDIPVLGIEPAPAPAAVACERGIPTQNTFFTAATADQIAAHGLADLIIANNVLAHATDQHDMVAGIERLLAADGRVVIEVPWVGDLLDSGSFDTVYHEHLCYFSLTSLVQLFAHHGLHVLHVSRLPTHGGSIRCMIARHGEPDQSVTLLLDAERRRELNTIAPFHQFARQACAHVSAISDHLVARRGLGQRIAAYGAAAKGTILLNTLGDEADYLAYVADVNAKKQGRFVPGTDLQIVTPQVLLDDRPDAVLLLPWNLVDEIRGQLQPYLAQGGELIVPLPTLRVLHG